MLQRVIVVIVHTHTQPQKESDAHWVREERIKGSERIEMLLSEQNLLKQREHHNAFNISTYMHTEGWRSCWIISATGDTGKENV